MGMPSPGLTVQGTAAQWHPWSLDVEAQGLSQYLHLVAALVTWLALILALTQGEEGVNDH